MEKEKILTHILCFICLTLSAHSLSAQIYPLKSAARVADRVIGDASFKLTEVAQRPLSFPLIVDCSPYVQSEGEITATATIDAPADSTYNIGFAASGSARVWINGKRVFKSDTSGNPFPREVAYDSYEFPYYATVKLTKGINSVEVKSNGKISLGVLDALGFADKRVKYDADGTFTDYLKRQYEPVKRTELRLSVKEGSAFPKHPYTEWHYANGTTAYGILTLGRAMAEKRYTDYTADFCTFSADNSPTLERQYSRNNSLRTQNYRLFRMTMLDDASAPALPLLELRQSSLGSNISSGEIIDRIANYVMKEQPRLADGTFVRPEPRWTIWADDLFMSVPFLVRYGKQLSDTKYYDEAAQQIINYDKYLYNPSTGLYYHGWNDTTKKHVGQHWGRANGWMLWAITEALAIIPPTHKDYDKIVAIYRRAIENIARYQSEEGMWHQLLNDPSSYKESSATAIFTFAMARGVASGILNDSYAANAVKGWLALDKRIGTDGIVRGICQSMAMGDNKAHYLNRKPVPNDPRGVGAIMMAAVEVDKLLTFLPEKSRKGLIDTLLVSEKIERIDPKTARTLWQVTGDKYVSNMPYFEAQAFTADDKYVIFKSRREGDDTWKIYRSHIASGVVTKLSDRACEGSFTIMPDGKRMAFISDGVLYGVDVESLAEAVLIDPKISGEKVQFSGSFTNDGTYTLIYAYNSTGQQAGTRIYRLNLPEQKAEQVFSTTARISHPILNPTDPNIITYVPYPDRQNDYSLSLEERARDYIIDVRTGEAKPFLMMPVNHRATHETWSYDGSRFFFFRKKNTGGKFSSVTVCSVDRQRGDLKEHYTTDKFKLGHGIADRKMERFSADSQDPINNPLMIIDLGSGLSEIICYPNSSQTSTTNDQTDHVHPIISASGRYAAFTSDGYSRGVPQGFVVALP